jgi:hypothetical protein
MVGKGMAKMQKMQKQEDEQQNVVSSCYFAIGLWRSDSSHACVG